MPERPSILAALEVPAQAEALRPIIELARATGWIVHLLHVAAPEPSFVGYDPPGGVYDRSRREHELGDEFRALSELATVLDEAGVTAEPHVIVGSTTEVILGAAEAWHSALIAVVGRRHSLAHRIAVGSVASDLLKRSPLPVMVLPHLDARGARGDAQ
jgi:nucleotide-binding universal stress UspA family protein